MEHSILPPSGAGIWGKPNGCTGWITMSNQYPDLEENQDALIGEASHWVSADLIELASRGTYNVPDSKYLNTVAPNGVVINQEMIDGAREYAADVIDVMRSTAVFGGDSLGIEKRLKIPMIHDIHFGTCDCFIFDRAKGVLYIWDYKFGHLLVEAFENWQSICYAAGIVDLLGIDGFASQHITVKIRIAQPRVYHREGHIREWSTTLSDLRGYWNILKANAAIALSNDAQLLTGKHCRDCSARYACPAAIQAGTDMFEVAAKPLPVDLTPLQIGVQLTLLKRAIGALTLLQTGFEAQCKSLIKSGVDIPGWMTEPSYGRETWSGPVSEIIALGKLMGHELKKPDEAITPNQARKLGIDASVISEYTKTPQKGIKVVPDNGNKAKQLLGAKS